MDGSKSPDLIGPAFYSLGVNVATRGGKPTTRPGLKQVLLLTENTSIPSLLEYPCNGVFGYYSVTDTRTEVIFVSGGKLLRGIPEENTIEEITPAGDTGFDFYLPCYFAQAERFLVIQNGVDIPWIYDGVTVRRSKTGSNNSYKTHASLTQTGGLATATTSAAHGFSSGDYIQIEDAQADAFNGFYYISVTGPTTFTYVCNSTIASPATVAGKCRYAPEVPVGTIMAYGQGRLFVVGVERSSFVAGDIIYGDLIGADKNILRFTETQYLAEGGDFSFPLAMGRVTGMDFVPLQDTATGQGELMVRGEYGVSSFAVSVPRTDWKNTQIQRITFTDIGGVSPEGSTFVNNDVFFRTAHGIQSYRQARGDLNSYGQTLVSSEVARILDADKKELLTGVSGATLGNRVLFTCSPIEGYRELRVVSITRVDKVITVVVKRDHKMAQGAPVTIEGSEKYDGDYTIASAPTTTSFTASLAEVVEDMGDEIGGVATATFPSAPATPIYRGVVSLDFQALAMIGERGAAAYDGLWTGMPLRSIFTGRSKGVPTLYFVRSHTLQGVSLWELDAPFTPDMDRDVQVRQQCALETRGMDFNRPYTLKKLARADLWVSNVRGSVDFRVLYRADGYPCWLPWHDFTVCAAVDDEIAETDPLSPTTPRAMPQRRTQRRLPSPLDTCDPTTGKPFRLGYNFQFRIEWTGLCTIEKFLAHAFETVEQMGGDC